jgi:ABC-type Na+ transport system ATPase subunit NatA
MDQVMRVCSHVIVIDRGAVVAQGALNDLRAAHDDRSLEEVFLELTHKVLP